MSLRLSICISTFNRAAFIRATLESIIAQATIECEIVVVDGASTDDTGRVVLECARDFDRLRYVRQDANSGIDRDFDRAIELALGEYCWLFSDDDILKPNAVATVLDALRSGYGLVLVNGEHRDFDMRKVRVPNFFAIDTNRAYAPEEVDRLFTEIGTCLICICCVVIRRTIWLARERERYYGSMFTHVGVIFQENVPGGTLVIAAVLMALRLNNAQTHAKEAFLVWNVKWPALVWSLPLSESTKRKFSVPQPWRRFGYLLALRSTGRYSPNDYRRWIRPHLQSFRQALFPILAVLLPRKMASCLYPLYTLLCGGPTSPEEVRWTMLPRSLKILASKPNN